MKKRGEGGIAALLVLGLVCAMLAGCGGTGGGTGGGGVPPGGTQMGGSIQGTPLSLGDNTVSTFVGTSAGFSIPIGITTDGTNLYIADSENHTIRRVVIGTGAVTTIAGTQGSIGSANGPGTSATFSYPYGITTDGTNLYVADSGNNAIRKVVIGGTWDVSTLAGSSAGFDNPMGVTTDGTNLYVADTYSSTIRRVAIGTGVVTTVAGNASVPPGWLDAANGTDARFYFPQGITTDGTYLYVADTNNHRIRRVTIGGTWVVSTLAGSASPGFQDGTGAASEFFYPFGITSDGTYLYVADSNNNTIRRVGKTSGVVQTVAGDPLDFPGLINAPSGMDARFNTPDGITTDGKKLYVNDSGNNVIRAIE